MFSLRALGPLYWVEMVSHRLLRYASGMLHLALLATSLVARLQPGRRVRGRARRCTWCSGSACWRSIALRGRVRIFALAHYYLLVTLATLLALGDVARGVPAVWERAEGTR